MGGSAWEPGAVREICSRWGSRPGSPGLPSPHRILQGGNEELLQLPAPGARPAAAAVLASLQQPLLGAFMPVGWLAWGRGLLGGQHGPQDRQGG